MSTAKAIGYLDLNINGFEQAISTAKKLMVGFAAGFSAYKLGGFFKDGIKDAIDFGKEMNSASRAMGGFDPGALLLVQKGLEKAGLGAEEARGKVSQFIEEGRDLSQLFGGADNYAKALKSAAQDYGSQASVLTRSAAALQTVWNTMEAVGSKVRTFFLSMTEQFVAPLQVALDYLNSIDLASVGEQFGKYIADAATTLFGIFKNGDTFEAVKIGFSLAIKEGVNYLVGGLNYAANTFGPMLGKAFIYALEIFEKGWEVLKNNLPSFMEAFVGLGAKFTSAILNGLNTVFRVMQAGIQMAVQTAIESIPGLSDFLGTTGQSESLDQLYANAEGIIPQDFIDQFGNAGKEITDQFGGAISALGRELFKGGEAFKFEKASVFDTAAEGDRLREIITDGFRAGSELNKAAVTDNANAVPKGVLTQFSGSSSRVIADNLARVGGGGNFLRQGMSLQERTALQQLLATKQSNATLEVIKNNTGRNPSPATLPR